jgi:hypothetical protein
VATSEKASPAVNACRADGNATASAGLAFPIYRAAEQDLDRPERHYDSDDHYHYATRCGHRLGFAFDKAWRPSLKETDPAADKGAGPIPRVPGEEDWTIWFVTRRSSRKAADIQRAGLLTLGYQYHPDRAYVALIGGAALIEDRSEIRRRWLEK